MISDNEFMFIINGDELLFNDYSVFLQHKDWAESLGIVEDEFNNMVRGTCAKTDGKWYANFYYNYDREDGRCAAAARKFAPAIMKYCKTNSLEILSDEEPFIIRKEHEHDGCTIYK
ncbi:hypothetical protein [Treponema sp. R80B11-R83G3]